MWCPARLSLIVMLAGVSLTIASTDEPGSLGLQYLYDGLSHQRKLPPTYTHDTVRQKYQDPTFQNEEIEGREFNNGEATQGLRASFDQLEQSPEKVSNLDLLTLLGHLQQAQDSGKPVWSRDAHSGVGNAAGRRPMPYGVADEPILLRSQQEKAFETFLEDINGADGQGLEDRFARDPVDTLDSDELGLQAMMLDMKLMGIPFVNCHRGRNGWAPCSSIDKTSRVHTSLRDSRNPVSEEGNNNVELANKQSQEPMVDGEEISRQKRDVEQVVKRSDKDADKIKVNPLVLPGKTRKGFSSWGGKRVPPFGSWGGKRDPDFHSWGGKRDNKELSTDEKQDDDATLESRRVQAFYSWGGKRAPFNSWGGKRAPFSSWGGKREPSFNSWGGKRAPNFNSWGGKRAPNFNSWGGKRAPNFNSWGGKREPNFNSWGGKRAPFNSWGGKRAPFNSWGGKRAPFNSWGGKRSDEGSTIDEGNKFETNNDKEITDAMLQRMVGNYLLEKLEGTDSNHWSEFLQSEHEGPNMASNTDSGNPWMIPREWESSNSAGGLQEVSENKLAK